MRCHVHPRECMEYVAALLAAVRTSCALLCRMTDRAMFVFLMFPTFCFFPLIFFYSAPVGSTVALTGSSCIPVRPQPLRACAETQAGVSPPRRSPPCIMYTSYIPGICIRSRKNGDTYWYHSPCRKDRSDKIAQQ